MNHGFPLSVGFPIAHFVDKTLPRFYHASLQFREGSEAQPIEIVGVCKVRAVVGTMRG